MEHYLQEQTAEVDPPQQVDHLSEGSQESTFEGGKQSSVHNAQHPRHVIGATNTRRESYTSRASKEAQANREIGAPNQACTTQCSACFSMDCQVRCVLYIHSTQTQSVSARVSAVLCTTAAHSRTVQYRKNPNNWYRQHTTVSRQAPSYKDGYGAVW